MRDLPRGTAPDVRLFFHLFAFVLALTALFHGAQAAHLVGDGTHIARHALFASIDALVAGLMLLRPPAFPAVFALLVGQQLVSHGGDLARTWSEEHRIAWSDVAVVVAMPAALVALVIDARARRAQKRAASSFGRSSKRPT